MMTLRKPLLSVYRRHRYTNFKRAILVEKAEMLSFISNPYIEPCFSTEKEILTHHFLLKLRAVKKVLDSRLVKNSRRLWNLDLIFSTADAKFFHQNTCKTGNNAVKMSQAFHDIARFTRFTELNLFKYAFNFI